MLDELALTLGFVLLPSITHVFDELALTFGFSSFPSQTQVFDDEALTFGLISLPDNTHVLDEEAPVFGFNSAPLQTQLLGRLILFDMLFPRGWRILLTPMKTGGRVADILRRRRAVVLFVERSRYAAEHPSCVLHQR
ncbi:MAG: hypothetical protein Q7T44_08125 [Parvibaculum sp.]|nr:hypothetical protein [Parvibaculum sp.]